MASNYPPGVTGSEPAITGELPFDPHQPFEAGPGIEDEGKFSIAWGNDEDHFWEGFETMAEAEKLAALLNSSYSLRDEQADPYGRCKVCGDFHGPMP